ARLPPPDRDPPNTYTPPILPPRPPCQIPIKTAGAQVRDVNAGARPDPRIAACVQRVGCRYLDGGAPGPVHLADDERLPVARGVGVAAASLAGAGPRAGHGADLAIPAFREALPGISIAVPPVAPLLVTAAGTPPRRHARLGGPATRVTGHQGG